MVEATNDKLPGSCLLLEVALETEISVSLGEHPGVDGTMGLMTSRATLAARLMLENERSALGNVAFPAGLLLGMETGGGGQGTTLVRIVTITATHLAFLNRMMMGQGKLPTLVQVTLETGVRGTTRVDNRVLQPAGFRVHTARSVAGFTTHLLGILTLDRELGVIGSLEVLDDRLMTLGTGLGTHKLGTGNERRRHHGVAPG